jgi:hypothetical protein
VSIMGRTVGVMHATSALDAPFADTQLFDLGILAKLRGARIGMLRLMSETQLQAATDALTGLLNRRSFEKEVTALRSHGTAMSLVMADLDHFKALNDTHGHPAGDRALALFAQMLPSSSGPTMSLVATGAKSSSSPSRAAALRMRSGPSTPSAPASTPPSPSLGYPAIRRALELLRPQIKKISPLSSVALTPVCLPPRPTDATG